MKPRKVLKLKIQSREEQIIHHSQTISWVWLNFPVKWKDHIGFLAQPTEEVCKSSVRHKTCAAKQNASWITTICNLVPRVSLLPFLLSFAPRKEIKETWERSCNHFLIVLLLHSLPFVKYKMNCQYISVSVSGAYPDSTVPTEVMPVSFLRKFNTVNAGSRHPC